MSYFITRPQPEADKTRRALDGLRLVSHICPLLNFERLNFELPNILDIDCIVITSTSALRGLTKQQVEQLSNVSVYCVGKYTVVNARKLGFKKIAACAGNSEILLSDITNLAPQKNLLYLTGVERKSNIEDMCKAQNINLFICETYRMKPRTNISPYTLKYLKSGGITHGLLFSERTAGIMLKLFKEYDVMNYARKMTWYCLSPQIANIIRTENFIVKSASEPNHDSLIGLIKSDL